jgi:hypothetical protein
VPLEGVPPCEVLLDANLLVLWTIGTVRPDQLGRHKRAREYRLQDYHLLCRLLREHSLLRTTPNILTEVSNLLEGSDPLFLDRLASWVSLAQESYLPARTVVQASQTFRRLGLSDATTQELSREGCRVITADLDLYLALARSGADVVNFHPLRGL